MFGPCTIDDEGCALSPNYPQAYGNSQSCGLIVNEANALPITSISFSTEVGYDELTVNGVTQKSRIIKKTLDPEWNETFSCDCDVAGTHLDVIVHDHDKGLLGSSSDYLGSVSIPLQFAHEGESWHTLEWKDRKSVV